MANNGKPADRQQREVTTDTSGQVEGIRVRSMPDTFRRAGIVFTREGVELALSDLTQDQLSAIEDEPLLSVQHIRIPAVADAEAGAKDDANAEGDA